VGQNHVTETLLNAFARDKIAHAYLFAGPRGVGKTTTARILAKALNCLKNDDGNPCNECQNCEEIASSRSMDVLEIDGASNRGIDEMRNLRELVKYSPVNAKFKVFIIDEVHMLTTSAFNALLKTLEEPPPHVKFIFATTEPNKILPTILSRCQRHDFHRMSSGDIDSGLKIVLEKEKITIDDRTEHLIISVADGSMRDALSLLDQMTAFCGDKVEFEQASKLLGIIPNALFFGVSDTIRNQDKKSLLKLLYESHSKGYALTEFVSGLNRHFLSLLICNADAGEELIEMPDEVRQRYSEESQNWDPKDLLRLTDQVTEMESKLKFMQQPKVYVETMMLKLTEMDSTVSLNDLISKLSEVGRAGVGQQKPAPPQATLFNNSASAKKGDRAEPVLKDSGAETGGEKGGEEEIEKKSVEAERGGNRLQKVQDQWDEIIAAMAQNGTSLSTFLSHGEPQSMAGKRLIISFPKKHKFQIDMLKKNVRKIETTIEKIVGEVLRIDFIVSENERDEEQSEAEDNPVTQRMVKLFGGEIVE